MDAGQLIRQWREKKEWTQRQLAEAVGCTDGYIAHLEGGVKLPSLDICMALVTALELTAKDQQRLLKAVEAARETHVQQRIRTRGAAVRGALMTRSAIDDAAPSVARKTGKPDVNRIAREIAADEDLRTAYEHLQATLADSQMRDTVLAALEAFARAARKKK